MSATGATPEPTFQHRESMSGSSSVSWRRSNPTCFGRFRAPSGAARWGYLRRGGLTAIATALTALAFAGCGGAAGTTGDPAGAATTADVATAPSKVVATHRTGPLQPGEQISATTDSPKPFAAALVEHRPVLVAFLLRGIADDDYVGAALAKAKASTAGAGVTFMVYDMNKQRDFGDLPALLGVTSSPSIVVIGRDGRLVNSWTGLVDEQMVRQSVSEAKSAVAPG